MKKIEWCPDKKPVYMSKKQQKIILKLLEKHLALLNSSWTIRLKPELKYMEDHAEITFVDENKTGTLQLGRRALEKDWDEIEDTIVHELVHVKFRTFNKNYENILEKLFEAFKAVNETEEEKVVNDLSKYFTRKKEYEGEKNDENRRGNKGKKR